MAEREPTQEPARFDVPMAELRQALLDESTVVALRADLCALADVVTVRLRHAADVRSVSEDLGVGEALDLLVERRTRAVQVVYRYEGRLWCDTLTWTPGGVRLVRTDLEMS